MSNRQSFTNLTPEEFLQTFIDEARDIAPFSSCSSLQSFIHQIVFKASACLEERYRVIEDLRGALAPAQYAQLAADTGVVDGHRAGGKPTAQPSHALSPVPAY